jgi:hypothetical protein
VTVHGAPGHDLRQTILPSGRLWGLGVRLTATPLTAAVLAAVADGDLGEASAIIDAARHATAGCLVSAVVPAPIEAGGGRGVGAALSRGYQPR